MASRARLKDSSQEESRNGEDLISDLPDSLIHHILSFLGMSDVVATSLLSRRWQHLWTSTPTLDFSGSQIWDPNTINIALDLYVGMTIRYFRISSTILGDDFSHGDSWIRFAVRHGVQELDLEFDSDDELHDQDDVYGVHHSLFTCGSIEVLRLNCCKLNLPTSVNLHLLRTLELCFLELTDMEIKVLTAGCPLLENMALLNCNIQKELNIFAPNRNLKSLRVHNNFDNEDGIEIFAPYVLSIELSGVFWSYCKIRNLSSIIGARINFDEALYFDDCEVVDQLVKLLSNLSQAKSLQLCGWCVQVLSAREMVDSHSLHFRATHLELKRGLSRWEWFFLGMAYLLRNHDHLESLTINIGKKAGVFSAYEKRTRKLRRRASDKSKYCKWLELSLSYQFSHLKTVRIYGFMGSKKVSKEERQGIEIDKFIQRRENEVELVRFFLKTSKALEKITISTAKTSIFCEHMVKSELLLNLTKRLQFLPKASQNAQIVFS